MVSSAPSKALATLGQDCGELISAGMVTINAKFSNIDDEKLLGRVVEIWIFFWDQVLTYLEGVSVSLLPLIAHLLICTHQVLLPLQTDPILSSLYRKPPRGSSPSRHGGKGSSSGFLAATSTNHIDVRSVALRSFRDKVILPLSQRLYKGLSVLQRDDPKEAPSHEQPRLQQM